MIKYKLKKEQWKEIVTYMNPIRLEDMAYRQAQKMNIREAAHCLLLTEIGVKIVKATMKAKPEISISFSAIEAYVMVEFLNGMTGIKTQELYIRNIAALLGMEMTKRIVNYQKIYQ